MCVCVCVCVCVSCLKRSFSLKWNHATTDVLHKGFWQAEKFIRNHTQQKQQQQQQQHSRTRTYHNIQFVRPVVLNRGDESHNGAMRGSASYHFYWPSDLFYRLGMPSIIDKAEQGWHDTKTVEKHCVRQWAFAKEKMLWRSENGQLKCKQTNKNWSLCV